MSDWELWLLAAAQHHKRSLLPNTSPRKHQNAMYGFYWMRTALAPSSSWKIVKSNHHKLGTICKHWIESLLQYFNTGWHLFLLEILNAVQKWPQSLAVTIYIHISSEANKQIFFLYLRIICFATAKPKDFVYASRIPFCNGDLMCFGILFPFDEGGAQVSFGRKKPHE